VIWTLLSKVGQYWKFVGLFLLSNIHRQAHEWEHSDNLGAISAW